MGSKEHSRPPGFGLTAVFAVSIWVQFGILWLFPAPTLGLLAPIENRELGLVELAQCACLIMMIVFSIRSGMQARDRPGVAKAVWFGLGLLLIMVLLEEADYGLFIFDFVSGRQPFTTQVAGSWRNVHNSRNINTAITYAVFLPALVFFGGVPLVPSLAARVGLDRRYAAYFWFIALSCLVMGASLRSNAFPISASDVQKSQIAWENVELGFYLLLWNLIRGFGQPSRSQSPSEVEGRS